MDTFEQYFNAALRFLSFRPRSEKEVIDNLRKKKVDPQVTEKIITKLKEKNFLNDSDFARWWIESRTRFKQRSLRVIKMELKQKGISKDTIEQILNSQLSIFNEKEQIQKLIQKKIARFRGLSKHDLYQKLGGFLARRGFDYETIKKSIDEEINKVV